MGVGPTVAACQMNVTDLDVAVNLRTIERRVRALPDRVDVALFPEYALTGFVADDRIESAALSLDADAFDRLCTLVRDHSVALLVGFVGREDRYYNSAAYIDPDQSIAVYRKRHLWAGERTVLSPGDRRVTVETPIGTTGLMTCCDLNFVGESAAFAEQRVDALFVLGAWPAAHARNWELLLRARALDGVRWVVGAGRTGERTLPDAPQTAYAGQSRIVRPDGSVLAGANRAEADVIAPLDPAVLAEQRKHIPVLDGGEPPR